MTSVVRPDNSPAARCVRCKGRMFPQGETGDFICFTCGNVVYAVAPEELPLRLERRPTHGGNKLS